MSLYPLLLLIVFLLSGCDLRALSPKRGKHGYHHRTPRHPARYDLYVHHEGRGELKYGNTSVLEFTAPDVQSDFSRDLRRCFLPTQRKKLRDMAPRILKWTCTYNYAKGSANDPVRPDYDAKEFSRKRNAAHGCYPEMWFYHHRPADGSPLTDLVTNLFLLFSDTLGRTERGQPSIETISEFQESEFAEVLEARYSAVMGNPKLAYDDKEQPIHKKSLYSYYFEDPHFIDFLERMEQSASPNARRFVPLHDYYTLRYAVCGEVAYKDLLPELKRKWAMLVFSKFTLRLYAMRDAFFGILESRWYDSRGPEDLAEALHSYFADVYEAGSGPIARSIAEVYTKFDLFELAYVQCTGGSDATPYLVEDHGTWALRIRLDHYMIAEVPTFLMDVLTIAKAWNDSHGAKFNAQALENAAAEISEFYEKNANRTNGNCQ
ncbi:hypothetical protein PAPHI01_1741 [Pancytospora philotis]|nr:hypothetical protein PAPHI01_1741 [Pancytospora philotis]